MSLNKSQQPQSSVGDVDDEKLQEHRRLANVVKGVHADLRKKYRQNEGDLNKIWKEHCQNGRLLTKYADAMHHLATDHWAQLPQHRITWCQEVALDFFQRGGLQQVLDKEKRRQFHIAKEEIPKQSGCDTKPSLAQNCDAAVASPAAAAPAAAAAAISPIVDQTAKNPAYIPDPATVGMESRRQSLDTVTLPFRGKIRLLDVGSCFNPFLQFDEFLAVGIDISPAKPSVYCCDFLHLETQEPFQVAPDTLDTFLSNLKSPIEKLPECSFHVVVFSLLLEYFPSPYQRWLCCQKAHKLLMINGLLLIVSPDSHQQHRNAAMVKSWKRAIESMGFNRYRYVKLEHLHCMAFRKIKNAADDDEVNSIVGDIHPDMLYIPQDSNELETGSEQSFMHDIFSVDNEEFFRKTINELPIDLSDDEDST